MPAWHPEEGRNAIVELAHQVLKLQKLQDLPAGTTINVGVIRGGTTTNVVPATPRRRSTCGSPRCAEEARIDSALGRLSPVNAANRLIAVAGSFNRPPMERSPAIASLFEQARQIGRARLGLELTEGSTGGGSDGNFTAALWESRPSTAWASAAAAPTPTTSTS